MNVQDITTAEQLQQIAESADHVALIDLWADWCGPCRAMAPHYEAAAEALADEPVVFARLDTENYPELARTFNVRSLPTIIVMHKGEILDVVIGLQGQPALVKKARWALAKMRGEGLLTRLFGKKM